MHEKYNKLLNAVKEPKPPHFRYGQYVFVRAYEFFPAECTKITGSNELDPFHNDGNVDKFLEYLYATNN